MYSKVVDLVFHILRQNPGLTAIEEHIDTSSFEQLYFGAYWYRGASS